jgi:heterodisulfide reductase subunit B
MRQCLNAGYDKVFTLFADPQLLEKTNESLAEFSTEERAKIQLIPVSKLAGIG